MSPRSASIWLERSSSALRSVALGDRGLDLASCARRPTAGCCVELLAQRSTRRRASLSSNRPCATPARGGKSGEAARGRRASRRISTRRCRACRCGGSSTSDPRRGRRPAGFSSPRLTDSIWSSRAPSSTSIFFTPSERRWPSATLYSRLPRSSVLPWISICALGFSRRYLACASTRPRYSSLTSNLSRS